MVLIVSCCKGFMGFVSKVILLVGAIVLVGVFYVGFSFYISV